MLKNYKNVTPQTIFQKMTNFVRMRNRTPKLQPEILCHDHCATFIFELTFDIVLDKQHILLLFYIFI